jgi:hypothetical protein
MLAAQSDQESLPIATTDPHIASFGVEPIW